MGIRGIANVQPAFGQTAQGERWEMPFMNTDSVTIKEGDIVILDTATATGTAMKQLPAGAAAALNSIGVCTTVGGVPAGGKGLACVFGPCKVNMEAGGTAGQLVLATNTVAGRGTGSATATLAATVGILTSAVASNVAQMFVVKM